MISTAISRSIAKGMVAAQDRHRTKREEILSLYRKAVVVIKEKPQWASGETVNLFEGVIRGCKARVWIKNESGRLLLTLFREGATGRLDKRFYGKPLLVGLFKPDIGWAFCGEDKYLAWNRQVRKAMEAK